MMADLPCVDWAAQPDEALVLQCRQRTREAEAVLIARYIPLINRIVYRHCGILDFDDLTQEGCIGLLDAIANFDFEKGASFRTYAQVCIQNRVYKALEKSRTDKARMLSESISLDEISETALSDDPTPEQAFLAQERLQAVLQSIDRALSPMERRIFFAHLGGFDYQTIADHFRIPLKSVDNALQRVRKKLKTIVQP
ncbi:MAG: sigma-70 family RNA polymerase sigma factor [Oscillospiraceae bacterium]|jgi:RNA polymerase sporulation-specific sigma factor|nr:sigma-70 family RNA polymerase sigma factor [Oscillospiraceae bacterium]